MRRLSLLGRLIHSLWDGLSLLGQLIHSHLWDGLSLLGRLIHSRLWDGLSHRCLAFYSSFLSVDGITCHI
jgi:hypothetical protein